MVADRIGPGGRRAKGDEGFYSRWSRRKRAADVEPTSSKPRNPLPAEPDVPPPTTAVAAPDAPVPAPGDSDMPAVESLDEHSDYAPFFSENVSAALRKTALRKLFRGGKFNVVDGLDDYDDDFRAVTLWTDSLIAGTENGADDVPPVARDSEVVADAGEEHHEQISVGDDGAVEPDSQVVSDDAESARDDDEEPTKA